MDRDIRAALLEDANLAVPAGASVLPAVRALLGHGGGTRAAPRRRSRPGRRSLLLALAAVVLIGGLAASPLASATTSLIAGRLMRSVGIAPADQGRVVQPAGIVRATSSGYTVTLAGVYADQFRTVLFLRTDPSTSLIDLLVRDESGRMLGGGGGVSGGPDGAALEYAGLTPGRHQLTAHANFLVPSGGPSSTHPGSMVRGDWTLRFPVDAGTTATLAASPTSGDLGQVHLAVAAIAGRSGQMLYVELHTTGGTIDALQKTPPEVPRGQPEPPIGPGALAITVLDGQGRQLATVNATASVAGKAQDELSSVTWKQYVQAQGPGPHRLVVTFEGHRFESRFTVT